MDKKGVLVVGSANMDLVVFTENFPRPGETVFGNGFNMFPGGKGANQAVSCARLGALTFFIAKLGKDDFGKSLYASMSKDNIDLDCVIQDESSLTGTALISVDGKGENEIIVISGANMELSADEIENCANVFEKVKVVLTQLEIPIDTVKCVSELASESGAKFILNPAPAQLLDPEILKRVDILTPNESELEILSCVKIENNDDIVTAARILIDKGVENIIVTLGERGAILVNEKEIKSFPSINVKAIDSTAAGDTFNGALAYCLANDLSIVDAINFSIKAAAISVTKKGAQVSMPTIEEINSFNAIIHNVQEEL